MRISERLKEAHRRAEDLISEIENDRSGERLPDEKPIFRPIENKT